MNDNRPQFGRDVPPKKPLWWQLIYDYAFGFVLGSTLAALAILAYRLLS